MKKIVCFNEIRCRNKIVKLKNQFMKLGHPQYEKAEKIINSILI